MNNIWDELNIEPTSDVKEIKRAYAQLLRLNNPENNPQGYQRLREAYEAAIHHAKTKDLTDNGFCRISVQQELAERDDALTQDDPQFKGVPQTFRVPVPDLTSEVFERDSNSFVLDRFIDTATEIYCCFAKRIDVDAWRTLFNSDYRWNVELYGMMVFRFLIFLQEHRFYPNEVWRLFEDELDLYDNSIHYVDYVGGEFVSYIRFQVSEGIPLSYSISTEKETEQIDEYLDSREKAYLCLLDEERTQARDYLIRAKELMPEDLELDLFLGDIEIRRCKYKDASDAYEAYLAVRPNDYDAYVHIIHKFYESAQYDRGISLSTRLSEIPSGSSVGYTLFRLKKNPATQHAFTLRSRVFSISIGINVGNMKK